MLPPIAIVCRLNVAIGGGLGMYMQGVLLVSLGGATGMIFVADTQKSYRWLQREAVALSYPALRGKSQTGQMTLQQGGSVANPPGRINR